MRPICLFVSLFFLWQTPVFAVSDWAVKNIDNQEYPIEKKLKKRKSFKNWWKEIWKKKSDKKVGKGYLITSAIGFLLIIFGFIIFEAALVFVGAILLILVFISAIFAWVGGNTETGTIITSFFAIIGLFGLVGALVVAVSDSQ